MSFQIENLMVKSLSWDESMQCPDADVFCKASKFEKSIAFDNRIIQFNNPVFLRLNLVHDLFNLMADGI